MNQPDHTFLYVMLIVIIGAIFLYLNQNRKSSAQQLNHANNARDSLLSYLNNLDITREFITCQMGHMNPQRNEFAVIAEESMMYEYKNDRSYRGVGTRAKIDGIPVYIGGGRSQSVERLAEASSGYLYLTNKRIVFTGDRKTFSVSLKDVVNIENAVTHITINSQKRQKPAIFRVQNGFMWDGLCKIMSALNLELPSLPDGVNIGNQKPQEVTSS